MHSTLRAIWLLVPDPEPFVGWTSSPSQKMTDWTSTIHLAAPELNAMSTISSLAEHSVLIDGVSWQTYSALVDELEHASGRMIYDEGTHGNHVPCHTSRKQ